MRFLSVCSGIEAASVAWNPLGWNAVAFSEIEPFPCAVLAHHYPDVPNRGDMTKFQEWPDADFDVLCGGTPCQSFSVAGLRKGLDDPRGNLMLTFGAIAARYRPKWLVWENVPGVLSSNEGRDFGAFLGMLGQLRYGFAYRVLDAQFFGVPQRRRRVFVVGCLGDWRSAAAVLFERHSLSGHPAPSRQAGQRAARPIAAGSARGSGYRNDADTADNLVAGPSMCLNAKGGGGRLDAESETLIPTTGGGFDVAHALTGEGFDASEDGTGRGTPLVPVAVLERARELWEKLGENRRARAFDLMAFSAKDHGADAMQDCSPTLRAGDHSSSHANAGVMPAIAYTPEIAATMVARSSRGGGQTNSPGHQADRELVATSMQVRRLTPRECARLQGFPDDYLDITYRGKPAADGPKYKAFGNSWAVPCAKWIGERISEVAALSRADSRT